MVSFVLYSVAGILLLVSFIKDKSKTKESIKVAWKSFEKLFSTVLAMMLFIGITLAVLNQSVITTMIGSESGMLGVIIALIIGSIVAIPSFVAFPLGGALLKGGAGYMQIAALVSTIMAVGIISLPVEIKYFNKNIAVKRIVLSFMICIVFTAVIGVVM
ncbi:permease [Pelosinus sp. sgz500959]|uniref:permease n=1 Tax=Pelosinus sp. sgz500959 TaxID=3242472 RepID=UPI0036700E09